MQVKIENAKLGQAIDLLFNMPLKGKKSRHRSKLVKLLQERLKEVGDQELDLIKEFAGEDEEGNPKRKEDGSFAIDNPKEFRQQQDELFEEEYVIDGGDAQGMLKTVKEVLLNYDEELSGQKAVIYDYLCDAFEEEETNKGSE
ncbi:DUF1617 family protein [Terribacillus sp. DMT04]|uniref:DUF1617 family protein n=1 Tax=Terribacillus sp. DMT04 TaxID=2850441 RepID=UPI001C2C895F|nr:DUF1617 family protein [Terribacillus sp. DMT04]QXE02777.1 DUF1617 family protein [Terribacillus sp. DMT04]